MDQSDTDRLSTLDRFSAADRRGDQRASRRKDSESAGKTVIGLIACAPIVIAFVLALTAFSTLLGRPPEERFLIDRLYNWINLGSLKPDMAFWVDPLSAVMILVVTGSAGSFISMPPATCTMKGVLALLRLPESLHGGDAYARHGRQPSAHVRGLGRRRVVLLRADWFLVPGSKQHARRK